MKISDHYRAERDATETTDERRAVFRTYNMAVRTQLDLRKFEPADPFVWRRAAEDRGLPTPYAPAWAIMSGDDLLELYDVLARARSAGEE